MTLASLSVKLGLDPKQFAGGLAVARKALKTFSDGVASTVGSQASRALVALRKRAQDLIKPLVGAAMNLGAVGSAALTAAPFVLKAAQAVGHVLSAALQASPALLGLAAAGGFVLLTMKQIGPAIGKEFEPVTASFKAAGTEAGRLAALGIRPLAAEFAKVNMPNIAAGMNRIAESTNGVVKRFLEWTNSTAGVQAIKSVVDSAAAGFERISPAVSRFAESLGNMLGRIAGVSTAAGASGLAGVLDYLSRKMDAVNAASVQGGLDKLKATYLSVRDAIRQTVDWIQRATEFYRQHRTEIGLVQDALAVLAIAFGGPVIAAIAAVGLIIRHWDQLKAAWQSVTAFFSQGSGAGFLDNLQAAAQRVIPPLMAAFQQIKAAVMPVLTEIWGKIKNQLIPAFGEFIAAISPVVGFLIGVLGPIVAQVFHNIVGVISGAISIITGILQVFTGILTGNWSKAWEGVKNILSGAWQAIVNLIQLAIFGRIGALLGRAVGFLGGLLGRAGQAALTAITGRFNAIVSWMGGVGGRILGALGNLGGLLVSAGRAAMEGLLRGIVAAAERVYGYVKSIASKIASLKGPLSYDRKLLIPAGAAIMAGLHQGILRGVKPVLSTVSQIAGMVDSAIQVVDSGTISRAAWDKLLGMGYRGRDDGRDALYVPRNVLASVTGAGGGNELTINSSGHPFDDVIAELIRRYVRRNGGQVQQVFGR